MNKDEKIEKNYSSGPSFVLVVEILGAEKVQLAGIF